MAKRGATTRQTQQGGYLYWIIGSGLLIALLAFALGYVQSAYPLKYASASAEFDLWMEQFFNSQWWHYLFGIGLAALLILVGLAIIGFVWDICTKVYRFAT